MSKDDFISKAIDLAIENVRSSSGGPFAAVVVRNHKIIATGTNQVTASFDPTAHAEITAIREACKVIGSFELNECEIYCSGEPCLMCIGAMYWARVSRLYFAAPASASAQVGFDDMFIHSQLLLPYSEQHLPIKQILHPNAILPFTMWRDKADKIPY